MQLFAVFVLLSTLALAQIDPPSKKSTSDQAVCPLSESQSQKSIAAFSKMVPTFLEEPRCLNCHGGIDPFTKFVANPDSPYAPIAEHGGGNDMDPPVIVDGKVVSQGTDCNSCHDHMVREGKWRMAPDDDYFIGQDARGLCTKMRMAFQEATDFLNHLKNDDFILTGFAGTRGLDPEQYPEVAPQPPLHIDAAGLVKLGEDWVASTGGEFKGDEHCGCEPVYYAIRVTASTEQNRGPLHAKSAMQQVDIPITFADDGTYSGEAVANFKSAAVVSRCKGESTNSMQIRASGQATEQFQNNSMRLQLENISPDVSSLSVQCPYGSAGQQGAHLGKAVLPFDLHGKVDEAVDYSMPANIPGVKSQMHLQIVERYP